MSVITGGKVIEGSYPRNPDIVKDVGVAGGIVKMAHAVYDFAVEGGAIGPIPLFPVGAKLVPSGAVALGGYLDVITAPTSLGLAELRIDLEGAGDVVANAVISGAPWSTVGRKSIVPNMTGANSIKTTTARNPSVEVGVAALTAGKFEVVLFYIELGS